MPSQSSTLEPQAGDDVAVDPFDGAEQTQVPASVPHFKSFEHIKDPRVRRAKDYEQHLQFALERFPEFAARIEREIAYAQGEQERSRVSDRDRVFLAIQTEELSKCEIVEDTDLPASTVYQHLRELVRVGLVYEKRLPGRGVKFMIVYGHTHPKI